MTTKDEAMRVERALKLALEALEIEDLACRYEKEPTPEHIAKAITAIRVALASKSEALAESRSDVEQPAQQPVAWVCEASSSDEKHAIDYWPGDVDDLPIGTKLYTSPLASKPLVGLTDEEINEVLGGDIRDEPSGALEFVRAIEAKLKEKNDF